jgi:hypothetical protein
VVGSAGRLAAAPDRWARVKPLSHEQGTAVGRG